MAPSEQKPLQIPQSNRPLSTILIATSINGFILDKSSLIREPIEASTGRVMEHILPLAPRTPREREGLNRVHVSDARNVDPRQA